MSKRDAHKELYQTLHDMGLLEYGEVIETRLVHEILGIEMPEVGTKAEFDQIALAELAAVDYVRNILLGQGKYITSTKSGYRILLPSENAKQIELYMQSADGKLSRALKLSRSSPAADAKTADQTAARIMLKKHGMRRHLRSE